MLRRVKKWYFDESGNISSHTHAIGTITGTASRAVETTAGGVGQVSAVTSVELNYLTGVTSAIQTQLDAKEAIVSLTASRALVSTAGGVLGVSAATSTELGYVSGVTSAIQTQLNALSTAQVDKANWYDNDNNSAATPYIQSGTKTCTNADTYYTVTFDVEYDVIPVVVATPEDDVSGPALNAIKDITTTTFKVSASYNGVIAHWIAIGEKA